MNLEALRTQTREDLGDKARPYLWSDPELDEAINEAEREACIRARLIEDASTPEVCDLDLSTTEKRYRLHEAVIDVLDCELASRPGAAVTGWTLTETELVFDDYPRADDTLQMTVIRLPLSAMTDDRDCPEIRSHHHLRLLDWVKYRAYLKQDADTFDEARAAKHEAAFERSFGARPDANVQRKHKQKAGRVIRFMQGGF